MRGRWALASALLLPSCGGEDILAPTAGSIEVTTATSGPEADLDGFSLAVDGSAGQPLGSNATVTLSEIAAGNHTLELSGVADNCAVQGMNPRSVTVSPGAATAVGFTISCTATTGSLQVSTATTGTALDPDGYAVSVDAAAGRQIGINASLLVENLPTGTRMVRLSGIADNCALAGPNPSPVEIPPGATGTLSFNVTCSPLPSALIAFESLGANGSDIFVVNPGTPSVNLTQSSALEFEPEWSPDRKRIAFASDGDVYVINADGTGRVNLTNSRHGDVRLIRWSPEGSLIAFETYCCGDGPVDEFDIWIVQADGSRQYRLATDAIDPSWSPDGSRLAFVPVFGNGFSLINVDGSGVSPLVPDGGSPSWSPDGTRIAFVTGVEDIETIRPDGSGRLNLTKGRGQDQLPVWSPDGTQIAFVGSNAEIGVMKADGSGRTTLTNNPLHNSSPTWAPDGSRIAFVRYDRSASETEVYVIGIDGSGELDVSNSPETHDDHPVWASR